LVGATENWFEENEHLQEFNLQLDVGSLVDKRRKLCEYYAIRTKLLSFTWCYLAKFKVEDGDDMTSTWRWAPLYIFR
jgi:hypothetical protein